MDDEEPHHPHRHLHHFVRMRVIHVGSGPPEQEFVDKGFSGRDMRLIETTDAVHAVRQALAMPMHCCIFGELVGDVDADLVALDRLDRRAGGLTIIAPEIGIHARRNLAHHGFGDEVEFLPIAIHFPRQGPAVERRDRLVIRPGLWHEWSLRRRALGRRRLRHGSKGRPPGNHAGAGKNKAGAADKSSARNVHHALLNGLRRRRIGGQHRHWPHRRKHRRRSARA